MTPSRNDRRYTLRSVQSSPGRSFLGLIFTWIFFCICMLTKNLRNTNQLSSHGPTCYQIKLCTVQNSFDSGSKFRRNHILSCWCPFHNQYSDNVKVNFLIEFYTFNPQHRPLIKQNHFEFHSGDLRID